jgi:hypothetical protein
MSAENPKRIGNIDGPWAMGLKFLLATYPVLLAWVGWISTETIVTREFRNRGDRFTVTDAQVMRREIDAQFASMPPKDWRDKYITMEKDLKEFQAVLVRIETTLTLLREDVAELHDMKQNP